MGAIRPYLSWEPHARYCRYIYITTYLSICGGFSGAQHQWLELELGISKLLLPLTHYFADPHLRSKIWSVYWIYLMSSLETGSFVLKRLWDETVIMIWSSLLNTNNVQDFTTIWYFEADRDIDIINSSAAVLTESWHWNWFSFSAKYKDAHILCSLLCPALIYRFIKTIEFDTSVLTL